MTIRYEQTTLRSARADAVVLFAPSGAKPLREALAPLRKILGPRLDRALELERFTGKRGTLCSLLTDGKLSAPRVYVAGLGDPAAVDAERIRRAAALAASTARSRQLKRLTLFLPAQAEGSPSVAEAASAAAEGALLAVYRFSRYLTEDRERRHTLSGIRIAGAPPSARTAVRRAVGRASTICSAVHLARDLANAPGNAIYPETLADAAAASGKSHGFRVTVWDERRIRKEGFGGLIAVSAGSARPPRFIEMEHNGGGSETVVLVGKGVTFDAGGISIKPASGMGEMKMDMSGAAAVIATLEAAARLKLPIRLIGLVPATENLLGGAAMRPGDVITHFGGKTSEVDNTDAEGRLILADALAYAAKFKPAAIVDLATLTGACVVALGHHATGMMGNNEVLLAEVKAAGERTFERVWPLPLFEEYEKQIRSDIADVKNVGGRWAGAITAGLFLKKFVGGHPWVHLDIAGTAMLDEAGPYAPRGGSGVGVRLLVDFLSARSAP